MDGFISPESFKREGSLGIQPQGQAEQDQATQVGNFKRPDGYHPVSQAIAGTLEKDPPVVLSAEPRRPRRPAIDAPKSSKHGSSWRKIMVRSAIGLFLVILLAGSYLFGKAYLQTHKVFKGGSQAAALNDEVDPASLRVEGDGRVNILLLGKGGDGHEGPDLTDTLLLVSIDPVHKDVGLVSIPRDLWAKPPGSGYSKINAVYANAKYSALGARKTAQQAEDAGLAAIDKTVASVLGIPIHYHVMVDFKAFKEAVNTVGGVDLNVTSSVYEALWDESTGDNFILNVQPGQQHFDGTRALFYARSRYTSPRGDFDRTQRQRALLVALRQKVFSLGTFANPLKVSQLLDTFGNHVRTNIGTNEIKQLFNLAQSINSSGVTSIGLADPPNDYVHTGTVGNQSVVIPKEGIGSYKAIQSYIRNILRDSFLKKENATVMVLNGTGIAGLATEKAEELKSFGYKLGQVGDAPTKNYQNTILVNLRGDPKKYTNHYLEQRLGTTAVGSLPDGTISPGSADFVIILGANDTTSN